MARKTTASGRNSPNVKPLKTSPRAATPVRNSAIPRPKPVRQITYDMIAQRAYEIWQSGTGGDEVSNWLRAERELRGM